MNEQNLSLSDRAHNDSRYHRHEIVFLDIQQENKIFEPSEKKIIWLNTAPSSCWCVALDKIDAVLANSISQLFDNRVEAKHVGLRK